VLGYIAVGFCALGVRVNFQSRASRRPRLHTIELDRASWLHYPNLGLRLKTRRWSPRATFIRTRSTPSPSRLIGNSLRGPDTPKNGKTRRSAERAECPITYEAPQS